MSRDEPDRDDFGEWLRQMYGFTPEEWAAIDELAKFEKQVRDRDQARMRAHLQHTVNTLLERLRAEGYDIPDGLRFEITP